MKSYAKRAPSFEIDQLAAPPKPMDMESVESVESVEAEPESITTP